MPRLDSAPTRLALRFAFLFGAAISAVCLVISMLTWSLPLAAISALLAILLLRNLETVIGKPMGDADEHD